mmetsp:Transcript_5469/g.13385  ORF Transcript_5469/g.13385 Transcript_5469/m.13385 type:complete len:216 (-) Transcript_5469:2551-3198(-)
MRWKLSTIAPTNKFIDTKPPMNIHVIKNKAAGEKSFRTGAWPGSLASIPAHMKSSQPSPVEEMYSSIIAEWKSSNEPSAGLSHAVGGGWPAVAPPCASSARSCLKPSSSHIVRSRILGSVHEPKESAKSCIPETAKTNWMARTTLVTLSTAGSALTSVIRMSFIPSFRASNRRGLSTRSRRISRSASKGGYQSLSSCNKEATTITKSSWFQRFLK